MASRKIRVGLNGFGPMGRQTFKAIHENYPTEMEVVAINDPQDVAITSHLLKYDSTYGHFLASVAVAGQMLVVNGEAIPYVAEATPQWAALGVDVVIEASEAPRDARHHLKAGARKVIVAGPHDDADLTLCLGANEGDYDPTRHHLLAMVGGTTNAVAPVTAVLAQQLGVRRLVLTTMEAYSYQQPLLDCVGSDPRRSRAATLNLIPTPSDAAAEIVRLVPALSGAIATMAVQVPLPGVSTMHLVAELARDTTREKLNAVLKEASAGDDWLGEVLGYSDEPLVSSDYLGNPTSATIDGLSTGVIGGNLVRLLAWYDSEWGYANRLADLVYYLAAEVETFDGET